jgi:hypothetical protein
MVCSRAPDPRTKIFTRLPYRRELASVRLVGKPKISDAEGTAALAFWASGAAASADVACAVRYCLQVLATRAPGSSVEVRVPPYGAVQVIEGPRHTRGTPPAVVEMSPEAWLKLATGRVAFSDALEEGLVQASGERSNLSEFLPCVSIP